MNAPLARPIHGDVLLIERLLAAFMADTNGKPFAIGFNTGIEYALKTIAANDDIAAILAGMEAAADAPPVVPADPAPKHYRTPQATVDAFLYVVRLDDPDYLARWLDQHPRDEKFLCKLWKAKNAAEA